MKISKALLLCFIITPIICPPRKRGKAVRGPHQEQENPTEERQWPDIYGYRDLEGSTGTGTGTGELDVASSNFPISQSEINFNIPPNLQGLETSFGNNPFLSQQQMSEQNIDPYGGQHFKVEEAKKKNYYGKDYGQWIALLNSGKERYEIVIDDKDVYNIKCKICDKTLMLNDGRKLNAHNESHNRLINNEQMSGHRNDLQKVINRLEKWKNELGEEGKCLSVNKKAGMLECETCKPYGYRFDFSPAIIRAVRVHIESEIHRKNTERKAYLIRLN
uniref:Uncharacterized protein n=1 Tax=Meloidogyne javanica TaxID=6303 RepID=A0A915M4K7_MELJA